MRERAIRTEISIKVERAICCESTKTEERAITYERTIAAEREEQRRSFVFGNCALENPDITRELVDRVADEMKVTSRADRV